MNEIKNVYKMFFNYSIYLTQLIGIFSLTHFFYTITQQSTRRRIAQTKKRTESRGETMNIQRYDICFSLRISTIER